jgi:putative ABC transport system permease protein
MLSPRWTKVRRDLFTHRTRTILVVLSIAVGVFAFGTVLSGPKVLSDAMRTSYLATRPASVIFTVAAFDDDLVESVADVPGVALARGLRVEPARIQTGPHAWLDAELHVLPEDGAMAVGIVRPWAGAWPPPERAVLIERASLAKIGGGVGDVLHLELTGQSPRELPLAGLVHDLGPPPAAVAGKAFGYVTRDTLEWLGGPSGYDRLAVVVDGDTFDVAHIREVAARVERHLQRGGREPLVTDVPLPPNEHTVQRFLAAIVFIMGVIGSLALVISIFLIVNTIHAILVQQTRQIGIMKAIGGGARQIGRLYIGLAVAYGLLALLIAVPLSHYGGRALTVFMADQLNVDIQHFRLPTWVVAAELVAALLVPVAAAAHPIRDVLRRPARESLSGASQIPTVHLPIDRLLQRIRLLSRPLRLSLRNTFVHRGRLVRTLVGLALGGAVFVSAMTLRASLFATMDESIASQRYDIELQLDRPYRAGRIERALAGTPGLRSVEHLHRDIALPIAADGTSREAMLLRAMPAGTTMFAPKMVQGRWLLPDDDRALVLSSNVFFKRPDTRVGDMLRLQIRGETSSWRLVGVTEELIVPTNPVLAYVTAEAYTQLVGGVGRSDTSRLGTAGHDEASHAAAVAALEQALPAAGLPPRRIQSRSMDKAILAERFNVIGAVLSILSLLIGAVGGLGLAGTMSMNVLERTREIAVLRAIGATDRAVRRIVVAEALIIALLAWLLGMGLSLPMSYGMGYGLGTVLLGTPLLWTYELSAVWIWLGVVLAIALVASSVAARSAVGITVREALAYE